MASSLGSISFQHTCILTARYSPGSVVNSWGKPSVVMVHVSFEGETSLAEPNFSHASFLFAGISNSSSEEGIDRSEPKSKEDFDAFVKVLSKKLGSYSVSGVCTFRFLSYLPCLFCFRKANTITTSLVTCLRNFASNVSVFT